VYNSFVDHWCLGVLSYEFLVGKPPFESNNNEDTYRKIVNVQVEYPAYLPIGGKNLISRLLKYAPESRLPMEKVLQHEWLLKHVNAKDES
jgi:serine/threonine protein kinase